MTKQELDVKYPMEREAMTAEQEQAFIADCFAMYEEEGFCDTFLTPYDQTKEYNGKPFEIVERAKAGKDIDAICLPMWWIRFRESDDEILAWPEEICKLERRI